MKTVKKFSLKNKKTFPIPMASLLSTGTLNLTTIGLATLAILFGIFTIILFKKFNVNDSTIDTIDSRLVAIETFPKYADFYSTDSNALTSNTTYAVKWASVQLSNDEGFQISGIGALSNSNAIVVPVTGVYQVTTTIQLSSTNELNDCYAFYQFGSNSDVIVPSSKRHLDFAVASGTKVAEIGISQLVSLDTIDKLSVWVQVNNSNASMFSGAEMPAARLSIVRIR